MRLRIAATLLLSLAACASLVTAPDLATSDTALLLLGEQHDEPEHQQLQREMVNALAGRGVLAALALEMADRGSAKATAGCCRKARSLP